MTYRSVIILGILLLALAGCVALPAGPAPVAVETPAAAPALTAAAPLAPTEPAAAAETPAAAPEPAPAEPLSARLVATIASPEPIGFITLSADGSLLAYTSATASSDYKGDIVIIDAATGQELRQIPAAEANGGMAFEVSFAPSGSLLAAVHADDTLRIWDAATGAEVARVKVDRIDEYNPNYYRATLSPDNNRLLFSTGSGTLQIYDVRTGAKLLDAATTLRIADSGWSADGTRVFALNERISADDGQVVIYDVTTGDVVARVPQRVAEPGRGFSVQIAAVSADGGRVIVAGPYVTRIIDRQTGRELFHLAGADAAFAAGADRLVTRDLSVSSPVRLWDSRTGELLVELGQAHIRGCNCIAISADGRRIAALARSEETRAIKIWEVRGQAAPRPVVPAAAASRTLKLAEPPASADVYDNPYPPAISRDGRIAVWNTGGAVIAWDLATGRRTYSGQITPRPVNRHSFLDQPGAAFADPSAAFLFANTDDPADPAARIWRVGAAEPQWTFPAGEAPLLGVGWPSQWAWSADARRVAVLEKTDRSHGTRGAAVWEPASGKVLRLQPPADFEFGKLAMDATGERIVATTWEGSLLAYDVAGGSQLWATALPAYAFNALGALGFSPDGRRLVVAAEDLTVRVLDAATGAELAHGTGLRLAPNVVAWRSDSRYFVTSGDDLTAVIWDAETAQPVRRLPGHDEAVSGAAFTPDGKQVVTLTAAFTVQYWDVADLE